jgi:4-hydroxy-3-methylbut-2-enyl diphosphate reductase
VGVRRVLLCAPRGFCAGVEKAIKALAWMVNVFDPPIYCYHEIVHNRLVVERFEAKGVVFVDDVDQVPPGAPLMLSAHGSAPEVRERARQHGRVVVDAVCPLVTKVHRELELRAAAGYEVLYAGHEGHEEAIGTMAVAPQAVHLVEHPDDVDEALERIRPGTPVAFLAQTTLSHDDWADLLRRAKERVPDLWVPARSDLCFATTNRQAALKAVAWRSDAVVVIGSANSSNTRSLVKVARAAGARRVVRVDDAAELPDNLEGVVALTAGASAPEALVEAVIDALAPTEGVEEVRVAEEEEYFPAPPELRELARALGGALALGIGAPPPARTADDRDRSASRVLEELAAS